MQDAFIRGGVPVVREGATGGRVANIMWRPFCRRWQCGRARWPCYAAQGLSFRVIGLHSGLSRQRVHQLIGTYERWVGARERRRLERWYFLEAGPPYTARVLADMRKQLIVGQGSTT
jgi:hypothetical protein